MTCTICGSELPLGAMFCGECGSSTKATIESRRRFDTRPGDTTILDPRTLADAVSSATGHVEAASPEPSHESITFVLRFSTGEKRTVGGSGLIGRRPLSAPGEQFDHLVQIADETLSVSKTHLEFGQHEGELWIADRFSGNGTTVHRPDSIVLDCEPGRRYMLPRGTRVELGQQHFTVG